LGGMIQGLRRRLAEPVDGASVAVFRIAFGLLLLVEVARFFAHGWIARYYIEPSFHFTYFGFGWVHPWPGAGMYVHFALLGAVAFCVAVGLFYRPSAWLLWVLFTYVFLLEEARYLNHFYAASLFAFLLALIPAQNAFSVDARRRRPHTSATVPAWALWLLRFQTGAIYLFGGIAKINPDWVRGEPMRSWLMERSNLPLIDLIVRNRLELLFFSYGGLLFDLLVVPALLWRRTRPFAFAAAVVFHTINSQLFSIGIFPWMMLAATTLFFEPAWPRRLLARWPVGQLAERANKPTGQLADWQIATLAGYAVLQIAIPLRHFLYPGNVSWTEEGHLFAWHMKLRDKDGRATFVVYDPRARTTELVSPDSILMPWQTAKMATRPDMILQFAHFIAAERVKEGRPVQVRVQSMVSLNGGGVRPMIDPRADLAAEPRTLWPAWWIEPGADDEFVTGSAQGARNRAVGNR
jgi:vitamin K-dependent gamma-carboxylase